MLLLRSFFILLIYQFWVGNAAKVLMVSFDGFRWDYLKMSRYNTSWFQYILDNGASSEDGSMMATFTTSTFPCHVTLSTGLFEESHGIIGNNIYDPTTGATFFISNSTAMRDPMWWKDAVPLWITAEKAGIRSGTYFWPGSEVKYGGRFQTIGMPYTQVIAFNDRVDNVVQWFSTGVIDFATLYFHQPDTAGHEGGPDSIQVEKAIQNVNEALGRLITKLKEASLSDVMNLVIVSDHGMAAVNTNTAMIPLYEQIESRKDLYQRMPNRYGAIVDFVPQSGKEGALFALLHGLTSAAPFNKMNVYRKRDIPDRYHYKNNARVPAITVVADPGYYLLGMNTSQTYSGIIGAHGYDNNATSMRPIFMAMGPRFKKGSRVKPFRQVDVYNIVTHLLGIEGLPNNGSWSNVKGLFNHSNDVVNGNKLYTLILTMCAYFFKQLS